MQDNLYGAGKIRQSASRMSLLSRILPFLIGDKVSQQCECWACLMLLCDIVSLSLAPAVTTDIVSSLRLLIEEHHTNLKALYPDLSIIPKMHFMVHYPCQILALGPLVRSWTMRHK